MLRLLSCICLLAAISGFAGCGSKPDVEVTFSAQKAEESTYTIVRLNADLLKEPPHTDLARPISLMMLSQGDQIMILETHSEWSKVQHVLSGRIGWLNNSFIQRETRSKWWSGDTDKARQVAEHIYKDRIFLEKHWPVIHISIEERWNKLVFTLQEGVDFPKDQALDCSSFAIDILIREFPIWKDHQVFIDGSWQNQKYTLVIGDSKQPTFL